MGQASDPDHMMGPLTPSSSGQSQNQSHLERMENYRSLKRRFSEIEKGTISEVDHSEERSMRMQEERDRLLQKLHEIEQSANLILNSSLAQVAATLPRANGNDASSQRLSPEGEQVNGDDARGTTNGKHIAYPSHNHDPNADGDVNMTNTDIVTTSQPLPPSRRDQRKEVDTKRRGPRSSRQRRVKSDAISTVAAAPAQAEVSASYAESSRGTSQSVAAVQDSTRLSGNGLPKQVITQSSTLANALGLVQDVAPSSSSVSALSPPQMQHTPSMESILKVAEAAVAAQNAATADNAANLSSSSSATATSTVDLNLDPSLRSDSSKKGGSKNSTSVASSSKQPAAKKASTTKNATASTSADASSSSSNLSNNPYYSMLPRPGQSSSPTGPTVMYPIFYPAVPGAAPLSNSPPYLSYNPYYFLTSPMVPGPNGSYPTFPPPAPAPPAAGQQQQSPTIDPQKAGKPKRLKAHTVTSKSFSIPVVPRDKMNKPMLPLNVGIMTVINLGEVCMREHFHTERYIFPVGYEVTRRYLSTMDSQIEVVYHCTILDGGDGPKFQIIPADRPDKPIIAGTATGAWSNIVRQANSIRNRQHSNSVSGPDFFGLGQNTIKHLIQELPNADRLRDYVWQNFVEGGPLGGRHAAVIPALPEEYDASMPIGAYYPKRDTPPNSTLPRGLSHYPQHIIAQAEAQLAEKIARQSKEENSASVTPPSAAPSHQDANSSRKPQQKQTHATAPPELNAHPCPSTPAGAQSVSQGPPKRRTTRSTAVASSSTSGRNTRATRSNQQQQLPQPQPQPNGSGDSAASEGGLPTTLAGIMKAYSSPGVAPSAPNSAGS